MNLERIINTDIEFIDGDRGQNYPSKSDFFENGYCVFLNTGNITKNGFNFSKLDFITEEKDKSLRKGKVKIDDVILTTRGTVGNVALVTEKIKYPNMRINSGMVIIRSKKDFTPLFLNTFFRSELFKKQASTNGSGSAQPQLPISALKNISIPKLDKKTQAKITSVLSALDEKIALNNETNATLEQMAKTLYDYWFVQFDFPDDNGKPYKSSGGEMVYNDVLKREIPKGWEVGVLGEIISLTRGLTYDKSEICKPNFKNSVGVLRATNVSGNVVDIDDLVYVSKNVSSNQIINQSNILIVMSSGSKEHIGKNGVYYFDENNAFGAFCSKVVPKIGFQNFVTTFLQSESFKSYVKTQCLGTNINNLNNSQITDCPIIKPDKTISHKFEDIVGKNFEIIKNNFLTNHELTRLRDWLLPMLMNGQVTVQ